MKTPIRNAGISLVLHTVILFVMLRYLHMGIYGVLYANILFALLDVYKRQDPAADPDLQDPDSGYLPWN